MKFRIILIILFLTVAAGFAAWFAFFKKGESRQPASVVPSVEETPDADPLVPTREDRTIAPIVSKDDADFDGITDDEETKAGTDPLSADTDGDGIKDKTELDVYHTDPSKDDTDGDGFGDFVEIKNGFDPLKL